MIRPEATVHKSHTRTYIYPGFSSSSPSVPPMVGLGRVGITNTQQRSCRSDFHMIPHCCDVSDFTLALELQSILLPFILYDRSKFPLQRS